MAVSKLMNIKGSKATQKKGGKHLINALEYISNPLKTENYKNLRGINCAATAKGAFTQMMKTKEVLNTKGIRQAYHFILSLKEGEGSEELMIRLTEEFLSEYLKNEYEVLYAVHNNTDKLHSHIIFNSVSYLSGKKYHYEKGNWEKEIQPILNRLCERYGLSTIDIEESRKEKKKELSYRRKLEKDLEEAIASVKTYDEFLSVMKEKKYKIKYGKYLAVKPEGGENYIRLKSVGELYSEDMIKLRIAMKGGYIKTYSSNYRGKIKLIRADYNFLKKIKYKKMNSYQKWVLKKYIKLKKIKKWNYAKGTYKYKDDMKKLREAQEDYRYIVGNNITSPSELDVKLYELNKRKISVAVRRKEFNAEEKVYEELVKKYERLQELSDKYIIYRQEGMEIFEESYHEYLKISSEIADMGVEMESIREYIWQIHNKKEEFKEANAEIRREINIVNRLIRKNKLDRLCYIDEVDNRQENINENEIFENFDIWSSTRCANAYTFDWAFNHITENDYSRDNAYIICDRLCPENFIKVHSTRDYYEGKEYTKSYYKIFRGECEMDSCDDGRFAGREKNYWYNLKKRMKSVSGMQDDNIIFEKEENFVKYLEAYKRKKQTLDRLSGGEKRNDERRI